MAYQFGGLLPGTLQKAPYPTAPTSTPLYSPAPAPAGSTGLGGITQTAPGSYTMPANPYAPTVGPGAPNTTPQYNPLPGSPGLPPIRNQAPVTQYGVDKVLQDSHQNFLPRGSVSQPRPVTQQQQQFGINISGGGAGQGAQGGGTVLGSSTSQPSWYGGGLTPASGLGGSLYPSLVSLYK